MVKTTAAIKGGVLIKNFGIGGGVWMLLAIQVPTVTEAAAWLELAAKGVALVTGVVMLFKHKGDLKGLLEMIKEINKK